MALPKNPLQAFTWGAGGAALTPEELAKRRELEAALLAKDGPDFSPVGHWTQGLARVAHAAAGAYRRNNLDKAQAENDTYNSSLIARLLGGGDGASTGIPSVSTGSGEVAATTPGGGQSIDVTGNEVYDQFMGTVKESVTNPYALAAIAATGKAESGFSPENVNRTWSDPSESGQAGTAGGIMSWRGPRYQALAATGDLSPAGQARFFLGEDPKLIEALNNAGSVEEAQSLMNNAWKFAGYDRPGGEAANRLSYANSFLPTFQGGGEVAAVTPEAAFGAVTSPAGASLADEVAEFEQTPEYAAQFGNATGQPMADEQFDDRFGQTALPAEANQGRAELAAALAASNQPGAGQQAIAEQTNAIPAQFSGSQQMADASGGIIPALMEGQPATEQQVAQAMSLGNQQQPAGRTGIDPQLLHALADPRLNQHGRQVLEFLVKQQVGEQDAARQQQAQRDNWLWQRRYEEQQQARDPLRQAQIEKMQREAASGGETFFGNPIAVQNADGSISYGQIGNRGSFRPIQLGEGQAFAPPTKTVDTGTESILMDQAGNVISRTPKQNRQEAREKAEGSAEGKTQAETQAEFDSITSKMPGLYGVVDRLEKLAETATYTMVGKGYDWARNQLGIDPREGAVARAEYTAVVDNQILPLLRDTFGAQFTAEEGQRLAKTLGDPDKSPTEKQALLRAFIQQKERDIQGLASRLGKDVPATGSTEKSIRDMTDEELEALANGQ